MTDQIVKHTKPGDTVRACINGKPARFDDDLWTVEYLTDQGRAVVTIKRPGVVFPWREVLRSWVVVQ